MPKIQEQIFNETMQYIFNKKTDLKILLKSLYVCEKNTVRSWNEIINDLFLGIEINFTDQENNNYFVKIITNWWTKNSIKLFFYDAFTMFLCKNWHYKIVSNRFKQVYRYKMTLNNFYSLEIMSSNKNDKYNNSHKNYKFFKRLYDKNLKLLDFLRLGYWQSKIIMSKNRKIIILKIFKLSDNYLKKLDFLR